MPQGKFMKRLGRTATYILAGSILTACAYGQGISWNSAYSSSPGVGRSNIPSFEEVIYTFAPSVHAAPASPAPGFRAHEAPAAASSSAQNPAPGAQKTDQPDISACYPSHPTFLHHLEHCLPRP